ncbi:MAG: restriction endonuclease subunit S [Ignavibacterium sp.]|nr:MAG: restriction endonuclease subunit S [Ignavibacterium sp.]GIV46208.1 MAG: restriction endonuclease subunit S [Ignavibacterium sp.]
MKQIESGLPDNSQVKSDKISENQSDHHNQHSIPSNWKWVKLGDVSEPPQYGYTTSASNEGDLKFLRTTDITSGVIDWDTVPFCKVNPKDIDKYILKDNDIVISRAGSIGYSILISKPPKAVFASYLIRFRPKTNPKFFALFLQSPNYWNQISEKKLGIAIPNVNATKLKDIYLPLPPLSEQKKIVEKIEELFSQLDSGVSALKKAKEQIRLYRQSVLASAFSGKLVREAGSKQKAVVKTEMLNEAEPKAEYKNNKLPDGWKWVKVSNVGEVVTGTTPPKNNSDYYGTSFPLYKPTDLNFGINTRDALDNLSELGATVARLLPEKSVMVTCIGATIGKTGMNRRVGATNQQINSIIINDKFIPEFVYYFCISEFFQKQIKKYSSSTTLPILNKSKFESLPFIEAPKDQQLQIVEEIEKRFSEADNLEKAIDESLAKAESLRQSILKQALEGKLV